MICSCQFLKKRSYTAITELEFAELSAKLVFGSVNSRQLQAHNYLEVYMELIK